MQIETETIKNSISKDIGINTKINDDELLKMLLVIFRHRFSGKMKDFKFGLTRKQQLLAMKLIGDYYSVSTSCDDLYSIYKNMVINESELPNYDIINKLNGVIKDGKQFDKN